MIAGVAAGALVSRQASRAAIVSFAVAGALPDVDLVFGMHSGPTHGIGAALAAGVASWLLWPKIKSTGSRGWFALAIAVAYSTHTLLDWLSTDTSPPYGVMALWPFSHEHFLSEAHLFAAVSRRYWLREFWVANVWSVLREILILGPLCWLAVTSAQRTRR